MKAQVLTQWTGTGTEFDENRPLLGDDYPHMVSIDPDTWVVTVVQQGISKWTDVTGQDGVNLHPEPNLFAVEIECDQATLDAIKADPKYQVLWYE